MTRLRSILSRLRFGFVYRHGEVDAGAMNGSVREAAKQTFHALVAVALVLVALFGGMALGTFLHWALS